MHFDLTNSFVMFNSLNFPAGLQPVIAPFFGNLHAFLVPPGLGGASIMVQSWHLSPNAFNGFVAFSDGHQLDFIF